MTPPIPFAAKHRAFGIARQMRRRPAAIKCNRANATRYLKKVAELSSAIVEAMPQLSPDELFDLKEALDDLASFACGLVPE
jgi:hypothetical protein